MKKSISAFLSVIVILLLTFASGCVDEPDVEITDKMYSDLDLFSSEFKNLFIDFETDMINTAGEISASDADYEITNNAIDKIIIKYPWLRNILFHSTDGRTYIGNPAPDAVISNEFFTKESFEGTNIISLPPIQTTSSGTISGVAIPVYSDGRYIGYVAAWWLSSTLMIYNYDTFKDFGEYHISIQDGDIVYYDSINQVIGENVTDIKRVVTPSSETEGTYTQKVLDMITLEPATVKGIWKEVPMMDETLTIYLGKINNQGTNDKYSILTPKDAEKAALSLYSFDRTHTKEETINRISYLGNLGGGIFNIYALDKKGNILSASGDAGIITGINEIDFTGVYGTKPVREFIIRASQGYGYVSFYHQTTVNLYPEYSVPVTTYVIESDFGDYIIAAVIPAIDKAVKNDYQKFVNLTDTTNSVHNCYFTGGYDALISAVNNGQFDGVYIIDHKGEIIASSKYPEIRGENGLIYTDVFGNSVVRQTISRARLGGGYASYYLENEDKLYSYLYYTLPLDNDLIVLSEVKLDSL